MLPLQLAEIFYILIYLNNVNFCSSNENVVLLDLHKWSQAFCPLQCIHAKMMSPPPPITSNWLASDSVFFFSNIPYFILFFLNRLLKLNRAQKPKISVWISLAEWCSSLQKASACLSKFLTRWGYRAVKCLFRWDECVLCEFMTH